MNCPKCGNPLMPNAEVCDKCGASLTINSTDGLNNNINSIPTNPPVEPQQMINNQTNISDNQTVQNVPTNTREKKSNPLLIIILLIVLLIVIGVVCYFTIFKKSDSPGNNNINNNTNSSTKTSTKVTGWDDYSLFIDGNEIKLPMKFSEFEAMGFYEMDKNSDSVLTQKVKANSAYGATYNSNAGNIYGLFTNGKTSNISLTIYNNSDEDKQLKDCYIIGVSFEVTMRTKNYLTIGDVKIVNNTRKAEATIGKTKYEDIESKFGPHYYYDYNNTLNYYPDSDSDGVISLDDLSVQRFLSLYFDEGTGIFEASNFYLYDIGNF